MSKLPYTYRIALNSLDTEVEVEKLDPDNNELGQPSGHFDFDNGRQQTVTTLSQKAFQNTISSAEIKELGTHLFKALFDQGLQNNFLEFYETAVHENDGLLRVELDINEAKLPAIAALPWEFMHVPDNKITGELWLATAPNVILSRRRARWKAPKPIELKDGEKLRIAVVVSAPNDADLGIVSYKKLYNELQTLDQQMGDVADIKLLDPDIHDVNSDTIDAVLEDKPHIFHFVGHGRLHDDQGKAVGQIALVNDRGKARWVTAKQFSGLFARYRPGIVLLQACEGGQMSASQAFAGVASQIVQHNIPVVLAMQYEVSNATARRFAREFYRRLTEGDPVDKAAQEGRYKIRDYHESRSFATPVLFMRVRNGRLFARPTAPNVSGLPQLSTNKRQQLLHDLRKYFSLSELRTLCFDLYIDYEEFPKTKTDFIVELIQYLEDRQRIDELVAWGKAERPFLTWDVLA